MRTFTKRTAFAPMVRLIASSALVLLTACDALAMPLGRAWTPIDTLKVNGHTYMVPDRFEPPRDGRIELVARGYYGPLPMPYNHQTYGLVWADSVWRIRWTLSEPAYLISPALTPPDRQMLVWKTTTPPVDAYYSFLVTADVVGDSVTPSDTIARVSAGALTYSGTAWGTRRWVAVRDRDFSVLGFPEVLRIFRSDERGHWCAMGRTGLTGGEGMRISALDANTVLVLTSERFAGVHYGVLRDTTFEELAPQLTTDRTPTLPALARRPGGGYWTGWDAAPDILPDYSDRIVLQSYRDGVWQAPDTLQIRWPTQGSYLFYGVELGSEGSEIPAAAWYGYSYNLADAADYIWTSFPTDAGFGVGERLEGSWDGMGPSVVRDENGDVWVAWWRRFDGVFWVHSYTTAESSTPSVSELASRPLLRWRLTEPASETWWAVLRAEGNGAFARVARLRATSDTAMSWADTSAPSGVSLRYAIRRECRDVRYQWTSGEATWEPRGPSLALAVKGANPSAFVIECEVVGANIGPLDARLYDLQGREVAHQFGHASGAGRDKASVPLSGGLRPGLYLLRVRAADGRLSPSVKIALVR